MLACWTLNLQVVLLAKIVKLPVNKERFYRTCFPVSSGETMIQQMPFYRTFLNVNALSTRRRCKQTFSENWINCCLSKSALETPTITARPPRHLQPPPAHRGQLSSPCHYYVLWAAQDDARGTRSSVPCSHTVMLSCCHAVILSCCHVI